MQHLLCKKGAMYISYPLYEAPYRYHINPNPIGHTVYAAPFVQNGATYTVCPVYTAPLGSKRCRVYMIYDIRGTCRVKKVPRISDTNYTRHCLCQKGAAYNWYLIYAAPYACL